MSGNVYEWVWDWYGEYPSGSQTDPLGSPSGSNRVYVVVTVITALESLRVSYRAIQRPDVPLQLLRVSSRRSPKPCP